MINNNNARLLWSIKLLEKILMYILIKFVYKNDRFYIEIYIYARLLWG